MSKAVIPARERAPTVEQVKEVARRANRLAEAVNDASLEPRGKELREAKQDTANRVECFAQSLAVATRDENGLRGVHGWPDCPQIHGLLETGISLTDRVKAWVRKRINVTQGVEIAKQLSALANRMDVATLRSGNTTVYSTGYTFKPGANQEQPAIAAPIEELRHSADFTSVTWFGTSYTFSKGNQAAAVKVLCDAWKKKTPTLSEKAIGELIGSSDDNFQLAKQFRKKKKRGGYVQHPAWRTMIQRAAKGVYHVVPPQKTN